MKYYISIFVIFLLFGCKGNNPTATTEDHHVYLEFTHNSNALYWMDSFSLVGKKVIITEDDTSKIYNLYSNGKEEKEELILRKRLMPQKIDTILSLLNQNGFYKYPPIITQTDSGSFNAGSVVIKVKRESDVNYKTVDATIYTNPDYNQSIVQDFIKKLESVLDIE